jgi:tetratricopeptide (TPR) repeat protein
LGRGSVYKAKKNYPMALADFTKAIELKPDDPAAHYFRGLIYQATSDNQSAIADLTIAVNNRPDAPDPHFARGVSYMETQEYKKALEDFQIAGTNKVNNYEAWANAGQAAEALGDKQEAARDYKRALQINSSSKIANDGLRRVGGQDA